MTYLLNSVIEVPCTVNSSCKCNCSVCKIHCNTDWRETHREKIAPITVLLLLLSLLLPYYYSYITSRVLSCYMCHVLSNS